LSNSLSQRLEVIKKSISLSKMIIVSFLRTIEIITQLVQLSKDIAYKPKRQNITSKIWLLLAIRLLASDTT